MTLDEALNVLSRVDDDKLMDYNEELLVVLEFAEKEILAKNEIANPTEEEITAISNAIIDRVSDLITERTLINLDRKGMIEHLIDENGEEYVRLTELGKRFVQNE